MRNSDTRSRRIAVLPEALMNAHLANAGLMLSVQHALERVGYGVIQLPPSGAPPEVVEIAVRFVVDQVQDYLKNAYEVVEVTLGSDADEASRVFRAACRSRGIAVPKLPVEPGRRA
ncbi:MAG: hypothetical protein AB7F09_28095 [Parvibaculaceae bacterium]